MDSVDMPMDPLPRALHRARIHGAASPERSWVPVGTVDAGVLAMVDGAGMVRVGDRPWSLDWWIGAEDRWHHPSREVTVRQRAMDASPVVETAARIPGGDVLQRAYGVVASAGGWRGPAVVVEVENQTGVPVALAFVVRPLTLDGPGRVARIEVDGPNVRVDGRADLLLGRGAARYCSGPVGSVASLLEAAEDRHQLDAVEDAEGRLEVAFVVPLAHTAKARVLLPVPEATTSTSGSGPAAPWDAPPPDAVCAGWTAHVGDGPRVGCPEPGWDEALTWASRLVLLTGPDEVGACLDPGRVRPAGPPDGVRAAAVAEALALVGALEGLDAVAGALAAAQRLRGAVRLGDRSDGTVALLHAVGAVLAGPFGPTRVEELVAPAAVAIRRVHRGHGVSDGLGPSAVRALRSLAPILVSVGQSEVAEDALATAASLGGPSSPGGAVPLDDSGMPRSDHPAGGSGGSALAFALSVRDQLAVGGGVSGLVALWDGHGSAGRSDETTMSEAATGAVPSGELGFDGAELAARLSALTDLFVQDGERGPRLLAAWPAHWAGAPVEAHGMPTAWGTVSFALRWHGGRPALLWEVEPRAGLVAGSSAPLITAPGLDPDWEGIGWSGEALLGEVSTDGAPPAEPEEGAGTGWPGEGDSFS